MFCCCPPALETDCPRPLRSYVLYHHRLVSLAVLTAAFWAVEMALLAATWVAFSVLFPAPFSALLATPPPPSPSPSSSAGSQKRRPRRPRSAGSEPSRRPPKPSMPPPLRTSAPLAGRDALRTRSAAPASPRPSRPPISPPLTDPGCDAADHDDGWEDDDDDDVPATTGAHDALWSARAAPAGLCRRRRARAAGGG